MFSMSEIETLPIIQEFNYRPQCNPPTCFIGSYPPVTPAGQDGPFFVNTYFLRQDRRIELAGAVPVRSNKFSNCN